MKEFDYILQKHNQFAACKSKKYGKIRTVKYYLNHQNNFIKKQKQFKLPNYEPNNTIVEHAFITILTEKRF